MRSTQLNHYKSLQVPKTFYFHFDLPEVVGKKLKHEIEYIIKSNESLAKNKIKNEIEQLFFKHKHRTIFMNTKKSKRNKPHKFVFTLLQRLVSGSSNKHADFQNMSIYHTWRIIKNSINAINYEK